MERSVGAAILAQLARRDAVYRFKTSREVIGIGKTNALRRLLYQSTGLNKIFRRLDHFPSKKVLVGTGSLKPSEQPADTRRLNADGSSDISQRHQFLRADIDQRLAAQKKFLGGIAVWRRVHREVFDLQQEHFKTRGTQPGNKSPMMLTLANQIFESVAHLGVRGKRACFPKCHPGPRQAHRHVSSGQT